MSGQIEKNVGKDQGTCRFMVKDQFLICMAFDILIFELCVEFATVIVIVVVIFAIVVVVADL